MLVNQNAVFLPAPYDAVSSMKTHDQSTCDDVVKEQICTLITLGANSCQLINHGIKFSGTHVLP